MKKKSPFTRLYGLLFLCFLLLGSARTFGQGLGQSQTTKTKLSEPTPVTAVYGTMFSASSILTENGNGSAIVERTVSFSLNNNGLTLGSGITVSDGVATSAPTIITLNVGSYNGQDGLKAYFAGDANYSESSNTKNFTVTKAITSISNISGSGIYGGAVTLTAKVNLYVAGLPIYFSLGGVSVGSADTDETGLASLTVTYADIPTNIRNATTYSTAIGVSIADTNNYSSASAIGSLTISKLGITGSFTIEDKTYDGTTEATVSSRTLNGVIAEDINNVELIGGTATFSDSNAGNEKTVTLSGAFLGGAAAGNYNLTSVESATANISKASSITVVTILGSAFTYTGSEIKPATVSVTGAGGLNLTPDPVYSNNINAGTANASYSYEGDANHEASSNSKYFEIGKANPTVVVTPYSITYDGAAHTATYTINGVNGESGASVGTIDVSATTHTNAGTYTGDAWSFTGAANYNSTSGTVNDAIGKANPMVVVTPYSVTYDGAAHTATYTINGVNGETEATVGTIDVSATTHTNAGTYTGDVWSFTGATNYNSTSGIVNDVIDKANPTVVVMPYSVTYDGNPHTSTGTVKGVLNEDLVGLDLSGTTHMDVGIYYDEWIFSGNNNYNQVSGTITNTINQQSTVITAPGSGKITICHRTGSQKNPYKTLNIDSSALAAHIAHGDFVGSCESSGSSGTARRDSRSEDNSNSTIVSQDFVSFEADVIPNPSADLFNLELTGDNNAPVSMEIYDMLGRKIKNYSDLKMNQFTKFGDDLQAGSYLALVTQGEFVRTLRLIKK